jgi:hypothetical protein
MAEEEKTVRKIPTKTNYNRSYYIKNRETILAKNRARKKYCRTLVVKRGKVIVRFD